MTLKSQNMENDGNTASDDDDELCSYLEKSKHKQCKPMHGNARLKDIWKHANKNVSDLLPFISQTVPTNSADSLKVASEEVVKLNESSSSESVQLQMPNGSISEVGKVEDNLNINGFTMLPQWFEKDDPLIGETCQQSSKDKTLRMVGPTNKLKSQCDTVDNLSSDINKVPAQTGSQDTNSVCVHPDTQVYVPDVCTPPEQIPRQLDFEVPLPCKPENKERFYLINEKDWLSMCEKVKQTVPAKNPISLNTLDNTRTNVACPVSLAVTPNQNNDNVYIHVGHVHQPVHTVGTHTFSRASEFKQTIGSKQSPCTSTYSAGASSVCADKQFAESQLPAEVCSSVEIIPSSNQPRKDDPEHIILDTEKKNCDLSVSVKEPMASATAAPSSNDDRRQSNKQPCSKESTAQPISTFPQATKIARICTKQSYGTTKDVTSGTNSEHDIGSNISNPGVSGRFVRRNSKLVFERFESSGSMPDLTMNGAFENDIPEYIVEDGVSGDQDFDGFKLIAHPIHKETQYISKSTDADKAFHFIKNPKPEQQVHSRKRANDRKNEVEASEKHQNVTNSMGQYVAKRNKSGKMLFYDSQNQLCPLKTISDFIEDCVETSCQGGANKEPGVKITGKHDLLNMSQDKPVSTMLKTELETTCARNGNQKMTMIPDSHDSLVSPDNDQILPQKTLKQQLDDLKKELKGRLKPGSCRHTQINRNDLVESKVLNANQIKHKASIENSDHETEVIKANVIGSDNGENDLKNKMTAQCNKSIKCVENRRNPEQAKAILNMRWKKFKPVVKPVTKQAIEKQTRSARKPAAKNLEEKQDEKCDLNIDDSDLGGLGEYFSIIQTKKPRQVLKESVEIQTEYFSFDVNLGQGDEDLKQSQLDSENSDGEIVTNFANNRKAKKSIDYEKLSKGMKVVKPTMEASANNVSKKTKSETKHSSNVVKKKPLVISGSLKKSSVTEKSKVVTARTANKLRKKNESKHNIHGQNAEQKSKYTTIEPETKKVENVETVGEKRAQVTEPIVRKTRKDKGIKRKKNLRFSDDVKFEKELTGNNSNDSTNESNGKKQTGIKSIEPPLSKKQKYTRKSLVGKNKAFDSSSSNLLVQEPITAYQRKRVVDINQEGCSNNLDFLRSQNETCLPVKKRKIVQVVETLNDKIEENSSKTPNKKMCDSAKELAPKCKRTKNVKQKNQKQCKVPKLKAGRKSVKKENQKTKRTQQFSKTGKVLPSPENSGLAHNLLQHKNLEGDFESESGINSQELTENSGVGSISESLSENEMAENQNKPSHKITIKKNSKMSKVKEKTINSETNKRSKQSSISVKHYPTHNETKSPEKRRGRRQNNPVSDKPTTLKSRSLWQARKKVKGKGLTRRGAHKTVDNTWRELLSEDECTYDIRQLEREEVKHINVRQIIKHILKTSSKSTKRQSRQTNKQEKKVPQHSKTVEMSLCSKTLDHKASDIESSTEVVSDLRSSDVDISTENISDLSDSDWSPMKVLKTTASTRQLTESILRDLKRRNLFGLQQLKESKLLHLEASGVPVTDSGLNSNEKRPNRSYRELHNSPGKRSDTKLEGYKSVSPIKQFQPLVEETVYSSSNQHSDKDKPGVSTDSGSESVGLNKNLKKLIPSPISKSVDRLTTLLNKATTAKSLKLP